MNEEEKCNLEVELILKEQYKNDCIKNFLVKIINKKIKEDKHYTNLQLLADVSIHYEKINEIIAIVNKILKPNNDVNNNFEINNFLKLK